MEGIRGFGCFGFFFFLVGGVYSYIETEKQTKSLLMSVCPSLANSRIGMILLIDTYLSATTVTNIKIQLYKRRDWVGQTISEIEFTSVCYEAAFADTLYHIAWWKSG